MKLINDIIFKTYLYFHKKDKSLAITRTLGFITLLEASLIVPLFAIINGISSIYKTPAEPNSKIKYYIGIPLYLILTFLNNRLIKSKLKELNIPKLYDDYLVDGRIKYIWLIFILPIIFVFLTPIIYGSINGTLRFPAFE